MPSTRQNITLIHKKIADYSREEIREAISEFHYEVLTQNNLQRVKIDPSTGFPPYLVTTAGTYQYDCPSDCYQTAAVFAEESVRRVTGNRPNAMEKTYYFSQRYYFGIRINSRDALSDTAATVTFIDDPGTTTEKYYHHYYIKPPAITTYW